MSAVVAGYGIDIEPREIALLCQLVENAIVGAPCGEPLMKRAQQRCAFAPTLNRTRCKRTFQLIYSL
jgi:L-arabinokinase